MLILGIDTSTDICSVGLCRDESFLGEINIKLKRRHSERLLPVIKHLFLESGYDLKDIEGIAVTDGPGSFTGLRIGLSTVQAFKKALNIPVYSISSLEYMAYSISQHYNNSILIPTIDARNKRVYTSIFKKVKEEKFLQRIKKDRALQVEDLIKEIKDYNEEKIVFGSGIDHYIEEFKKAELRETKIISNIRNFGGFNLASLGYKYLSAGYDTDYTDLVPKYLKKPQARLNWEKKYLQGD